MRGQTQATDYHLIRRIFTDTGENAFPRIDPVGRRLYGIGNQVLSLDDGSVVMTMHNPEHGVVLAPELRRGLGTDGAFFDLDTFAQLGHLDTDGYTTAYDSSSKRAFLFRRKAWVVDMRTGKVLGIIDIGGNPEGAASDNGGRVFVNLAGRDSMVVIDASTLRVINRWSLGPCHLPTALSIDIAHHRLFASCQRMVAVLNFDTGSLVATVPVPHGAVASAFDPTTGLLFNPDGCNADSLMTVIHEDDPNHYRIVDRVPTGPTGSRLAVVDPVTHRVFVIALPETNDEVLVFEPTAH